MAKREIRTLVHRARPAKAARRVKRKRRAAPKVRLKATRTAAKAAKGPVVVRKVRRRKIVRKLARNRARAKVPPIPLWPDPGTVF